MPIPIPVSYTHLRNRIVAPVDLIQKFISFIQHLLHFRRCVLSVSLLFSLMFFFFLFLKQKKHKPASSVIVIGNNKNE